MKKIMFSDKVGLTGAVLKGKKTMTRRQDEANVSTIATDSNSIGQQRWWAESGGIEEDKTKWRDLFIESEGSVGKSAASNFNSPRG